MDDSSAAHLSQLDGHTGGRARGGTVRYVHVELAVRAFCRGRSGPLRRHQRACRLPIATPRGHVLIDGGLPESAPLIERSIRQLGFKVEDVEVLLTTQAHFDHVGSLAALQKASGGKVMVMEGDAAVVENGGRRRCRPTSGWPRTPASSASPTSARHRRPGAPTRSSTRTAGSSRSKAGEWHTRSA